MPNAFDAINRLTCELDWGAQLRTPHGLMDTHSLAIQGQPRNVGVAVESMLNLLLPMLGNRWRMGEASTSDVVMVDAATLDELNRTGQARASALYVVFEEPTPPPANALCTVRRPLSSSGLVEALHRAHAELTRRRNGSPVTTVVAPGFDKDSTEVRGIRASMRAAVRWALQRRSTAATVLSPAQATIFSVLPGQGFTSRLDSSEIAGLIRSNGQVTVLILNDAEQAELLGKQRKYYPFKRLEWIYWLAGSNGELRRELNATTPYRLSRWPDFSRLPHFRADVCMASLLKADALTIGDLSERAGVRRETAINFVNACWSLGLLAPSPTRESTNPAEAAGSRSSLADQAKKSATGGGPFGSLRSALGLGAGRPRDA
jgi:hypothetical protein